MDFCKKRNDTCTILDKGKEIIFIERDGKYYKCKKNFTIIDQISLEEFKEVSERANIKKSMYETVFLNAESQNIDQKIALFKKESESCNV